MKVWVVDTETTGTDSSKDRVVEVGGMYLDDLVYQSHYEALVDPGIPIPPEASAVHHIVDRHVKGAVSLLDATAPMRAIPADYYVAHNARFDSDFLGETVLGKWICTYKCALRKYPDAPSYSNQVLRYWLDLPDPQLGGHAHRALYDVEVTAALFQRMVSEATSPDVYDRMHEISMQPALLRKVNFGEHRGKLWSEIPVSYLSWMLRKSEGWDEDKLFTARHWMDKHRGGST